MFKILKPVQRCSLILGILICGMVLLLPIATAANLEMIRVKSGSDKTDIVLDLQGKADDYVVTQTDPQNITIQFSGHVLPSLKSHTLSLAGHRNLVSLYWENQKGKVQVFIKRRWDSNFSVYPLENPNRIVMSVAEPEGFETSEKIAPGVVHRRLVKWSSRGPLNINVLDIDTKNPDVVVQPVLATDGLHGKAKVVQMVNRLGGLAGINASYFKPDTGTTLGTVIMNKELIAGPIYQRVCLGITPKNQFKMARLFLKGELSTEDGKTIAVHTVNQPRLNGEEYILYTPRWGSLAPNTPTGSVQIQIENNQIRTVSTDRMVIPPNGFVLIGPQADWMKTLQAGQKIAVKVYTAPDWSDVAYAISGGPYLVKDGNIYVDSREEAFKAGSFTRPAPRTAVGFTANNHLLMVTVDGRQKNLSVGVTLEEMASLMKGLGAQEAMNFDGGSSTQMVINGQVVNSPTVGGGAQVSSSLVVKVPTHDIIGASSNDSTNTRF